MRLKASLTIILLFFLLYSGVYAQEIGGSTEEIIENVSQGQKPQAVIINNEECKILGIFNCLHPKVDYVHGNRLPETKKIKEDLSFWEKMTSFLSGLFQKSSDPSSGYGYTYLPKEYNTGKGGDGESLAANIEETHEAIKKSYLPYMIASKITPDDTDTPGVEVNSSLTPGVSGGGTPNAQGNSAASFAESLYETAIKACGKTGSTDNTKTLAGTYSSLPAGKDAVAITCLEKKVNSDVYLDLKQSADGNSWLQCVGLVIGVEQSQKRVLPSRNAKDFCSGSPPSGYKTVSKNQIAPGDIVANIVPPWGHIMTILEVYKGSQSYLVAEANWEVSGSIQISRVIYGADIDCVLRPN